MRQNSTFSILKKLVQRDSGASEADPIDYRKEALREMELDDPGILSGINLGIMGTNSEKKEN